MYKGIINLQWALHHPTNTISHVILCSASNAKPSHVTAISIRWAAVQIFPTSSFPIAGIINTEKHFLLHYKFWIDKAAYYWYDTLTLVRADDPQEGLWFGLQQDKEPAACGIIQSRIEDKTRM